MGTSAWQNQLWPVLAAWPVAQEDTSWLQGKAALHPLVPAAQLAWLL